MDLLGVIFLFGGFAFCMWFGNWYQKKLNNKNKE